MRPEVVAALANMVESALLVGGARGEVEREDR
jgi:hypothetical protein